MVRRMGKNADDQYMGGGSGNFNKKKEPAKKAEKKERVAPPKPRAKPKKAEKKSERAAPPKPRAKPAQPKKEAPKRAAKDKDPTPKAGSARKAVATSGASRSTANKTKKNKKHEEYMENIRSSVPSLAKRKKARTGGR